MAQLGEEQAALDALSELGTQLHGAQSVLLHPSHVVMDIASKALGRAPSPDVTLAAVHALATIAGSARRHCTGSHICVACPVAYAHLIHSSEHRPTRQYS